MLQAMVILLAVSNPPGDTAGPAEASGLARRAVAERLAIAEDLVSVEKVEPVDWPDASLGCPGKGEMSAQVITPGYRVRLRAADQGYEVHVGAGRARICPGRSGAGEPYLAAGVKVAGLARKDLAARLGIEPREVTLVSMKPTTWPDQGLGCPGKERARDPLPTKGFILTLRAGDTEYVYHADTERAVACPAE